MRGRKRAHGRRGRFPTCGGYDLLAAKFDCTPFRTPSAILDPVVGALTSAGRVLDVGCGTGASLTALEPITTERLVGLDFSGGMLTEASRVWHRCRGQPRFPLGAPTLRAC